MAVLKSSPKSSSSNSSSSVDGYKPGGDKPPDYKDALKCRKTKEDETEPSLVDDVL